MVAFLVLLLVVVHGGLSMGSLNDEGYALLSFKQSISQDPEASLSNWNSSDQNPCSWNGVTCKDLRVVSLSVPRKKLLGFIPSSLGSISGLRHLNLRNNRLYGHLPSELFSPQGLQSLVLYGNSLSGSVPKQVGKLNYLQILDLSSNFLNGSLPESILECRRLRALDLSQNNLTGALPAGFGKALSLLERLDLSFNMFSGSIPGDIGNLSNLLGTLDLSHNRFSGPIPASLGNLPEKVYIDLTHNNLSGPIPQNGALMNRGPTAFLGNPGLCGPPLKSRCAGDEVETPAPSSSSFPYFPENSAPGESQKKPGKGLSKSAVVAIVVSDAVGICLAGLLFSYCYSRVCDCREARRRRTRDGDDEKGVSAKKRRECLCFRKDHESSEIMSEKNNNNNNAAAESNYDLVALDCQVGFDLDELLKASAFVLGKSGIGIVYKVVLEDGLTLAVRRLGEGGSQRFKEFQTEVEAIGKLRHPNIAALKAYYWSADEKLLIYDYVPNGNLSTALHGKPSGAVPFAPLSWALRLKIMRGIARGLLYLHEFSPKKYVHGDLKPTNVLLDHSFEPRISDFGLARLATIAGGAAATSSSPTLQSGRSEKTPETTLALSPGPSLSSCYVAPEALKMVKPSQKWDVYSYGVVLLEMVTGRSPVVQVGPAEAVDLVHWIQLCVEEKKPLSEVLDPVLVRDDNADVDDEIVAVIKIAMACIQTSPEKRPTMRHLTETLERI